MVKSQDCFFSVRHNVAVGEPVEKQSENVEKLFFQLFNFDRTDEPVSGQPGVEGRPLQGGVQRQ